MQTNNFEYLSKSDLNNKVVIVRANLDVPVENIRQGDETRFYSVIKTINFLLQRNCKVIILSHFGEKLGEHNDSYSLMDVRFILSKLIGKQLKFANAKQCLNSIKYMHHGEVLLIENLYFHPEEFSGTEEDQKNFLEPFLNLGEIFVHEAFGINDEEFASIKLLKNKLPTYYGFHFEEEVKVAKFMSQDNLRPFTLILGGKFSTHKFSILEKMSKHVNKVIFGGEFGIAYLAARDIKTGKSKFATEEIELLSQLDKTLIQKGIDVSVPIDHICINDEGKIVELETQQIEENFKAIDIGPKTLVLFREIIEASQKIFWYGPMGMYEDEKSNKGTEAIGEYIALSTPKDAFKVAGGTSTSLAITLLKIKHKRFDHITNNPLKFVEFFNE